MHYNKTVKEILQEFKTSESGLKEKEIDESVRAFYSRKRRFGGLDKEDEK